MFTFHTTAFFLLLLTAPTDNKKPERAPPRRQQKREATKKKEPPPRRQQKRPASSSTKKKGGSSFKVVNPEELKRVNTLLIKHSKDYGLCGKLQQVVHVKNDMFYALTKMIGPSKCSRYKQWYKGYVQSVKRKDIYYITVHFGPILNQVILWCRVPNCVSIDKRKYHNIVFLFSPRTKNLKKIRRALWRMLR